MTPLVVKNAALSRDRSSGFTMLFSYHSSAAAIATPTYHAHPAPTSHPPSTNSAIVSAWRIAGLREAACDPEIRGHRVDAVPNVALDVLRRVDHVEAGRPQHYREPEHPRRRVAQRRPDRSPSAGSRKPETQAQPVVAQRREALRVRIDEERDQRDRREQQTDGAS